MKIVRNLLLSLLMILVSTDLAVAQIEMFATADKCLACHNRLTTSHGEDVSIGRSWAASMMANSARDPYWQASVRREVIEHPEAAALIEDTCASCHMPMARYLARLEGRKLSVFEELEQDTAVAKLALDGVSCNVCHQIEEKHFGERESFNAGFVISETPVDGQRPSYGPYPPTEKSTKAMKRMTDFIPIESAHLQSSEMCATCHTLYTPTLDHEGNVTGELPEQMPYLEWKASGFAKTRSCQSCHMPVVEEAIRIALGGEPREGLSRHQFRGGNAFMLSLLAKYPDELNVEADVDDLAEAARVTRDHLATAAARLRIEDVHLGDGRLEARIELENLGGHKLPTAYPSRRVWLHLVIRDASGKTVFESGMLRDDGSIAGNANDEDRTAYEPHYEVIEESSQVQIWEPILADGEGEVTTALLRATRYVKDNRILPQGFDKKSVSDDIAVRGAAYEDDDFGAGSDSVRIAIPLETEEAPFTIEAEILYQSIGFRWAKNLELQDAAEIDRFARMYRENAAESAALLAKASITTAP